jgi:hypothetical protein
MTLEEFRSEMDKIDMGLVADEIFWWLKDNILTYVDTYKRAFSLSFLSHEEKMPETSKMEHLCYQLKPIEVSMGDFSSLKEALDSDPEIIEDSKKQDLINDWMDRVLEAMNENEEKKTDLFKALSYYYEVVGFYKKNPIAKELEGYIKIDYLSFENMRVPVTKTPMKEIKNDAGEVVDYQRDEENTEVVAEMPPSFCIDFSIDFWEKKSEQSIF